MGSNRSKHILIVEDSKDLQSLLSQLFIGEGYMISRAYNGQQALEMLRSMEQLPSLILLDIMMPVMDGMEFREEQKMDPRLSGIPVVVMTADSNSQAKNLNLDVADFIRKPIVNVENLLEVIARSQEHTV